MDCSRQEPILGSQGQARLQESSILIVGIGALGSVNAELLCRAGVLRLTLQDFDIVQEHNLHRQAMYTAEDIGRHKVDAAEDMLRRINPDVSIETLKTPFGPGAQFDSVDCIIDGTDDLHTRLVMNDLASMHKIPLIIGTASGTRGMIMPILPDRACWQCVMLGKQPVDDCTTGILGMTTYAVASLQASLAIRSLLGECKTALHTIDIWTPGLRSLNVKPNPECNACKGIYSYLESPFEMRFCVSTGRLQARPSQPVKIDISSLDAKKDYGTAVLCDVRQGKALVHEHGLIEFENVEEEDARVFASSLL